MTVSIRKVNKDCDLNHGLLCKQEQEICTFRLLSDMFSILLECACGDKIDLYRLHNIRAVSMHVIIRVIRK